MKGQSQKRWVKIPETSGGDSEQYSEGSMNRVIHQTSAEEQSVNSQSSLVEWLVGLVLLFDLARNE